MVAVYKVVFVTCSDILVGLNKISSDNAVILRPDSVLGKLSTE